MAQLCNISSTLTRTISITSFSIVFLNPFNSIRWGELEQREIRMFISFSRGRCLCHPMCFQHCEERANHSGKVSLTKETRDARCRYRVENERAKRCAHIHSSIILECRISLLVSPASRCQRGKRWWRDLESFPRTRNWKTGWSICNGLRNWPGNGNSSTIRPHDWCWSLEWIEWNRKRSLVCQDTKISSLRNSAIERITSPLFLCYH